jgi:hypothetical protein
MKRLIYLAVFLHATLIYAQRCQIAGQVFFADVFDHAITLKTDSGDLVNLNYDEATSFLLAGRGSGMGPEELNNGDRVCVENTHAVVVTPRSEIQAEQKRKLADWQADSLYGVVSELNREARRVTLAVSAANKTMSYSVDVSPKAVYWFFPQNARHLSDAVSGSLDGIVPGDTLYVRGTRDGAGQKFDANLVVSGGLRSFAATIETMEVLDETLEVRMVLSGNRRSVHISLGELYGIGRTEDVTAGKSRRLYQIAAADLKAGDTVLILGNYEGPDSVRACALIAGFSPFSLRPPDPNQQLRWIFDNVPVGEPTPTSVGTDP